MHLHEYQAKNILQQYGIPTPSFAVAADVEQVMQGIKELGLGAGVVKVQIHAGGRGKAGGVQFAQDADEIVRLAENMIGMKVVNEQTGPLGFISKKILISAPISYHKEFYIAATIDRAKACAILILCAEGGMEIEEIARKSPEKLLHIPIQLDGKIRGYHLIEAAKFMGWDGNVRQEGMALLSNLARAFMENDGALLEINPLVLTEDGHLTALDAKFTVDEDALFRQPALAQLYDATQMTPNEAMAHEFHLAYIGLDGTIGCLVNGAGLAMATMDIIRHVGGDPANFLDVGGSATKEEIAQGFRILLQDSRVASVFINIFGGIMDCGTLAEGILAAVQSEQIKVPLVVRLEGTNVERGKQLLKEANIKIILADTMEDGAQKAVQAAKGGK